MKKRAIFISLSILILLILVSCNKKNDDKAEIQIWAYYHESINPHDTNEYYNETANLITSIKMFCYENEIPIKFFIYSNKTLSYEDYTLKRNIAAANVGNMIIIEDARYLWDLYEQHADYTKLESYAKILDVYKNRFCIPIGTRQGNLVINRSILNYYNIELDKPLITYDEYLEVKQSIKDKGAKFYMNQFEFSEKLNYYINKFGLLYINNASKILNNMNTFKMVLKSVIVEICNDFIKYNDSKLDVINSEREKTFNVYDENSGLDMYYQTYYNGMQTLVSIPLTSYDFISMKYDYIYGDNVVVWQPFQRLSPSFYMYKKISNDRIYEIANFIVSEESFKTISGSIHASSPSLNGELIREVLELDESFNYNGNYKAAAKSGDERSLKIIKLIDETFNMLIKNNETSMTLADSYFINEEYFIRIKSFIAESINKLSESNFNFKDKIIDRWLEEQISEFVKNFNIHYK